MPNMPGVRFLLGIQGRLALAIVLTAAIPLGVAVVLARNMVQQTAQRFFVPEVRQNIEQSLELYGELARSVKANLRLQAQALALDPALQLAAERAEPTQLRAQLAGALSKLPELAALSLETDSGTVLASVDRGRPVDEQVENQLIVTRPLPRFSAHVRVEGSKPAASSAALAAGTADEAALESGLVLNATFAVDKARFGAFEQMGEFVTAYSQLEERREADERSYVLAFAALLGITILLSVVVGSLLAGGVTRRVTELALATRRVAGGDLSIRVHEDAQDEIGDLARAFNRMLREVENSRDRIEYLSRLASWQEMARRLAHEIKNPLTPIQLAVQEVHQRLGSLSKEQQQLLDVALEIVETEVQTLRRLVGEFSEFARLPQSHMEEADLVQFLQELEREHDFAAQAADTYKPVVDVPPQLSFELPSTPASVYLDRQMMRRVLLNLLTNASQAARGRADAVRVQISVRRQQDFYELLVDDDGPGVSQALRSQVFEPYVTTKDDGTGLGLAIVKKIVIEHKGHIEMLESPLGGARVRILLPLAERSSTPVLLPHVDS